jgi:hypothetical protein
MTETKLRPKHPPRLPKNTFHGTIVDIIGGTYKGKVGKFLNFTLKGRVKVSITLNDMPVELAHLYEIVRCLHPDSVTAHLTDTVDKRILMRGIMESQPWIENDLHEICVAFSRIGIQHDDAIFVTLIRTHFANARGTQLRTNYDTEDDTQSSLVASEHLSLSSDDGE